MIPQNPLKLRELVDTQGNKVCNCGYGYLFKVINRQKGLAVVADAHSVSCLRFCRYDSANDRWIEVIENLDK